jgi:hypothetical protein
MSVIVHNLYWHTNCLFRSHRNRMHAHMPPITCLLGRAAQDPARWQRHVCPKRANGSQYAAFGQCTTRAALLHRTTPDYTKSWLPRRCRDITLHRCCNSINSGSQSQPNFRPIEIQQLPLLCPKPAKRMFFFFFVANTQVDQSRPEAWKGYVST